MGRHLGQRALLGDRPGLEDHDTIGQGIGVDRIMGDEHGHSIERVEMTSQVPAHLAADRDIEGGERLVEEEQPRIADESAGEGDSLGLAAGELAGSVFGVIAEADSTEPIQCRLPGLAPRRSSGAQTERDVLHGREVRKQEVVLEDDADRSLLGGHEPLPGGVVERDAVDDHEAVVDGQQPGEAAQQRRLSGTIGTEHRQSLSGRDGELRRAAAGSRCRR